MSEAQAARDCVGSLERCPLPAGPARGAAPASEHAEVHNICKFASPQLQLQGRHPELSNPGAPRKERGKMHRKAPEGKSNPEGDLSILAKVSLLGHLWPMLHRNVVQFTVVK